MLPRWFIPIPPIPLWLKPFPSKRCTHGSLPQAGNSLGEEEEEGTTLVKMFLKFAQANGLPLHHPYNAD